MEETPSRYLVGIDLGTTNSSCAYVDTAEKAWAVRDFLIPQLVAPGVVEARETLPSFHYQAAAGEFPAGALRLPWSTDDPNYAVGLFARDHGAAVPARLIVSVKSWLCHPGVDRTAGLLPWHGAPDVDRLSPVDVSSRYLAQIRAAWDHQHPDHPLAQQDVILTVPASFDEVARELTVEAARRAGLVKLTLVEEPQAAFYAWLNAQGEHWRQHVHAGQKILVCDIGGGTTDFTLIRVRPAAAGNVLFHRVAVGQHLILGGDNLDLAVAHHVEAKATNGGKLPPRDWGPLLRSARNLKETFLSDRPPEQMHASIGSGGSKLIGGAKQVELTRAEIQTLLLDGFLPRVDLNDKPVSRRSGFQEFSLPYAPDAAITKYLAAFLTAHQESEQDARPDIILFNGGFFASPQLRQRLLDVLSSWFSPLRTQDSGLSTWHPHVLANDRLYLAVSRGAAYYGMVRRGHGVRITGGLAHSYYIGVDTAADTQPFVPRAICLLPAGIEEGHDVDLQRTFNLLIRQPVEFPLFFSATRTTDKPGQLVEIDPEQLTALPPIRTVLQSGKKTAADTVSVQLHARLTEIGTLELWAQEVKGDRQWKLHFDVRSASRAEVQRHTGAAELEGFVDESVNTPARELIKQSFSPLPHSPTSPSTAPTPASLVKRLELVTGASRADWPTSLLRSFWEALIEVQDGRKLSLDHEARWLSLAGYCLRPGYGLAVDDWRVAQTWRLFPQKLFFPKNELCRAEWWILWRRLAGGLSAGQQTTLAEPLLAAMKSRLRAAGPISQPKTSPFQYGPHESAEVWRLLGSLELLKPTTKADLSNLILDLLPREKTMAVANAAWFAAGRIASRVPVYAGLDALLPADVVEPLVHRMLSLNPTDPQALFALVQSTRRTDDRYRDLPDVTRERVLDHLEANNAPAHHLALVRTGGTLEAEEQKLTFGEALPRGLRID
jgi:hypothetical protein